MSTQHSNDHGPHLATTSLERLTQGTAGGGIARASRADAARLARAGWRTVAVTGRTKRELLDGCARRLDFPDYFGGTLDGLLDCLRDVTTPTALLWSGWEQLRRTDPRAFAGALDVLRTRAQERGGFAVVLVDE